MLKKKQIYREDKQNINSIKTDIEETLDDFEHFEDSKVEQSRGRQLTTKSVTIGRKNLNSDQKSNKNSSKNSKVLIEYQSKRKIIDSKGMKINTYKLEEEFESSDSDLSARHRRRENTEDCVDFPENLHNIFRADSDSLENSQDLENYDVSDDLLYNCEDNLTNEIERILIEIYNNHISFNNKKKLDISKYEKHIKFFSKTLNKQYNIFILQILSEKIKELINRYKEKIFEIPEIKQIRDRYYEIKASLVNQKLEEENKNYINNDSLIKSKTSEIIKSSETKKIISPIKTVNIQENKKIEFNEPDKSVTKILLLELRNIKNSLIESSKDIEKVFNLPLSHLRINNKVVKFSIEEMHREEFTNTLIEDEFISALISQIKTIAKQLKIDEINQLISLIEEDLNSPKKEMSKFTSFLISQLKCFIESDYEEEEEGSTHERSFSSDLNINVPNIIEVKNLSITASNNSKTYTTNNTSKENSKSPKTKPAKIANDIGIDELLEYIEKPNETKTKNNKKKNRKKKNNINKKELQNQIEIELKNTEEFDKEIEQFKQLIKESSKCAKSIKKIRPIFSKEWLSGISTIK